MKPNGRKMKDEVGGTGQQLLTIFQQINQLQSASKVQLFEMVKLFRQNPHAFQQAWQIAYLKIFKLFHQRANRKMPPKYQQLATNLFTQLLSSSDDDSIAFYNYFLSFLSEAVFSSIIGIRITAARMLFHLLKSNSNLHPKTQDKVLKAVYYLVRLKVSTYKQIGIKLASIMLGWQGQIRNKIEEEMFKVMSVEENQQIRRLAITNMWINKYNLDRVLIRLRDKCPEIRNIILKKLIGEKYPLQQTTPSQKYRLLYDGYGNKQLSVQQDTLKFFQRYFDSVDPVSSFPNFVVLFQPNTLLGHPHLYVLFDKLISDIVQELPSNIVSDFVRKFTSRLRNLAKGNQSGQSFQELIWLKSIGRSDQSQLRTLFDQSVPSGSQLANILLELVNRQDAFAIYQCLQLFNLQKSSDEMGRNRMFDALKKMIVELNYWKINRQGQQIQKDDICPILKEQEIQQKKLLLSFFDLPPITCSFDLLFEAGRAMKALWPDHYEIQLKQLMADWNNPEENTLFKQKQLAQTNISKAEGHADERLMQALRGKLLYIQQQIERQNIKTFLLLRSIMRLRPNASIDDYMLIIRAELSKKDQTQGLLLLGFYCLEEQDRAQNFLPLYWAHILNSQSSKLSLLISIKVTTDFFVNFDFTKYQTEADSEVDSFAYSAYLSKLQSFAVSGDPDIRILAIQSLCRLIFHGRVPQQLVAGCFMRLLLLWWQTSNQQVSARSVHTISIFIKQYIQKGQRQVRKLSQWLCVFFKMLLTAQKNHKMVNKKIIVYNLKAEQFVKRAIIISMTVLKYHKESRQIIWKYNEVGAQLGPQQLFILFLFEHSPLHFCLEKVLNICDFYEEAPLETLILVKKHIQSFLQSGSPNLKKTEGVIKKLQADLQERIQIKNKQTFNDELLNGLKEELHQYSILINSAGQTLERELTAENILAENLEIQEEQQPFEPPEEEPQADIGDLDDSLPQKQEPKMEKVQDKKQKKKRQMIRISEKAEKQEQQKPEYQSINEISDSVSAKQSKQGKPVKQKRRVNNHNRKRIPQAEDGPQMVQQANTRRIIANRTRSRLQI